MYMPLPNMSSISSVAFVCLINTNTLWEVSAPFLNINVTMHKTMFCIVIVIVDNIVYNITTDKYFEIKLLLILNTGTRYLFLKLKQMFSFK